LLERWKIKRAPVMRGGMMVGLVSRADLLKALLSAQPSAPEAGLPDDAAIRAHVLDELKQEQWASTAGTSVEVSDGIVTLWGNIGSESERTATRVLAENIAGVRGVEDNRMVLDFPAVTL